MAQDKDNKDNPQPAERTADLRRGRKFSLAEAIGRAAGGSLKGASPVPVSRQLLMQIDELLNRHLNDNEGALAPTIMAGIGDNPQLLATHQGDPAGAVCAWLEQVLAAPSRLTELVRQTDVRWGQDYAERPHFQRPGQAPDPADPYTLHSVQSELQQLHRTLSR